MFAGAAAQAVRSGVQTAAGAAETVQMLASPVMELAGPVMQSVADSTGRVFGPNGSADVADRREPLLPRQHARADTAKRGSVAHGAFECPCDVFHANWGESCACSR